MQICRETTTNQFEFVDHRSTTIGNAKTISKFIYQQQLLHFVLKKLIPSNAIDLK